MIDWIWHGLVNLIHFFGKILTWLSPWIPLITIIVTGITSYKNIKISKETLQQSAQTEREKMRFELFKCRHRAYTKVMKFLTYTVNTTKSIEIKSAPEDFDRVTIDFEFLFGIDIVECCKEIRACLVVMASDGVSEEEKKKERDKVSALINNKLNKLIPQYIAFDQYKNESIPEEAKNEYQFDEYKKAKEKTYADESNQPCLVPRIARDSSNAEKRVAKATKKEIKEVVNIKNNKIFLRIAAIAICFSILFVCAAIQTLLSMVDQYVGMIAMVLYVPGILGVRKVWKYFSDKIAALDSDHGEQ